MNPKEAGDRRAFMKVAASLVGSFGVEAFRGFPETRDRFGSDVTQMTVIPFGNLSLSVNRGRATRQIEKTIAADGMTASESSIRWMRKLQVVFNDEVFLSKVRQYQEFQQITVPWWRDQLAKDEGRTVDMDYPLVLIRATKMAEACSTWGEYETSLRRVLAAELGHVTHHTLMPYDVDAGSIASPVIRYSVDAAMGAVGFTGVSESLSVLIQKHPLPTRMAGAIGVLGAVDGIVRSLTMNDTPGSNAAYQATDASEHRWFDADRTKSFFWLDRAGQEDILSHA